MRLIDGDALIPSEVHTVVVRKLDGKEVWESVLYAEQIDDAPTVDAVPVNWIEDYLEQIHKDLDCARQDSDEEAMKRIFWKYETIRWMVADWRHDEKTR